MENTLISHTLNRKVLKLGPLNKRTGLSYDNNILISELNDYDMSYNVKRYLFKVDQDRGSRIVRGLYDLVPLKTKHLFVLYTNTTTGLNMTRMTQNIWVFGSDAEANEFMPDMLEQLTWVKGSHLVELPVDPDFSNPHWIDEFIDPYVYQDFGKVLQRARMHYSLIQEQQLTQVDFQADMTLADFKRYNAYNIAVYQVESQLMTNGISKYVLDECIRLNKRRQSLQK